MPEHRVKILKNVFLSADENLLKLVDIQFSDSIEKIIDRTSAKINWQETNTFEKRKKIIRSFQQTEYPSEVKIYDGEFFVVIPGGIDSHVHFNTPGFEDRDDFEHGSTAAAFGGVTTVIDMPCTSIPPVTNKINFNIKLEALKNRSLIDYYFWGGVCGNDFDNKLNVEKQITDLSEKGVAGFKTYLISGMETFSDLNEERILQTAKWVKKTNKPMAVHAEDKKMIFDRSAAAKNAGQIDWRAYCAARDEQAEASAIKLLVDIAQKTECRIHVVHLSSKPGLDFIREAQSKGLQITAETCPHYLFFTQNDFNNKNISSYLKTAPPVKNSIDREALWQGLNDGTLSFVVTDHAGCNPEKDKSSKNFWEVYGGIPGVEHRVPFLFSEGFLKNKLTLSKTIKLLSTNVADYFNLKGKGHIKKGYDADFALINLWKGKEINSSEMHSKGKYTPFHGDTFNSIVEKTFLRGQLIMNSSGETERSIGYGKILQTRV
ncbi:MAG: allantoinase [Ignavibacteria bacterium CG2_30_36_16]|nr:MAG: allantoinase [Ignavibacteria bacterium CG2_30_36_16]